MAFLPVNVFKQIINHEIPANIVYETDTILAFRDINPKATTHILIIPKEELVTAKEINQENLSLFGELFLAAKYIAEMEGLQGYKLHMNVDEEGGQVVPHLHLHLLSSDYKTTL